MSSRLPCALVLASALAAGACGRTGATSNDECMAFRAQQLNATTGSCVGPPVATEGLAVCHDPTVAQSHGVRPVCVVAADGRLFRGTVTGTEWLEGAGWTHSELSEDASTLSAADEARCATAKAAPACQ